MLTPSLEDYLEEIYRGSDAMGVRPKELAQALNVSMPAVTRALQRLADLDCIHYRAYEEVGLTGKGRTLGEYLVYRNRVLLGFVESVCPGCNVPEAVESMEHYVVPELVLGLSALMGFLADRGLTGELERYVRDFASGEPIAEAIRLLRAEGSDEIRTMRRFGGKARVHPDIL